MEGRAGVEAGVEEEAEIGTKDSLMEWRWLRDCMSPVPPPVKCRECLRVVLADEDVCVLVVAVEEEREEVVVDEEEEEFKRVSKEVVRE